MSNRFTGQVAQPGPESTVPEYILYPETTSEVLPESFRTDVCICTTAVHPSTIVRAGSFLRSYSSVSVSASAVDISVVGKKRSLVDVDAQETDRVDGQGQATCMVQLKPAKVLTISDLTLSPVTAQTPCFAQDCLDLVMDYLIKTVLQPRNAAVREGSSKRNADATMTWIPCKEYSATPLLEKMQLGCLLPAHTCPCPDDYVFSQSKVWCIDLVDTYNIALECPECKEAGRYPSKLAANCWSHQAASDSGVSGS